MKVLVTFDIDNTLIGHAKGGYSQNKAVSQAAFELLGIKQDIPSFIGCSFAGTTDYWIGQEIVKKACPNADNTDELTQKFLQLEAKYFEIYDSQNFQVLPGVSRLLEHLVNLQNVEIALCTGNLEAIAWSKLRSVGIEKYFTKKYGGFGEICERENVLKKAIESAEVGEKTHFNRLIHVGDAIQDEDAARRVGAIPICVETGHMVYKDFNGPCFVVKNFEEGFDDIVSVIKTGKAIHESVEKI
ncbi:hypothetical protein M9Y10_013409 [Tritrichomonas musculus]|uniref:Haloacid dehalogenase-like hydrolase family protein n=1 Tax=Tritrichomonas musculus TaxID=1915356 RepID=A0ABR2I6Z6_9EUKA